jgi:hypothetical protein
VQQQPVLYLDLDDTVITWRDGSPRAAPGAREFVLWALERFEVRWLTTWCPGGVMEEGLLGDLCRMLEIDAGVLGELRGFDWEDTGSKLNGVAWLEHVVQGRPFLWIEDEYGVGIRERWVLEKAGFIGSYRHVNVTEDPGALRRLHQALLRRAA